MRITIITHLWSFNHKHLSEHLPLCSIEERKPYGCKSIWVIYFHDRNCESLITSVETVAKCINADKYLILIDKLIAQLKQEILKAWFLDVEKSWELILKILKCQWKMLWIYIFSSYIKLYYISLGRNCYLKSRISTQRKIMEINIKNICKNIKIQVLKYFIGQKLLFEKCNF